MPGKDDILPILKDSDIAYLKNPGLLQEHRLAYEKTLSEGKTWSGPVPPTQVKNPFTGEVVYARDKKPSRTLNFNNAASSDPLAPFGGSEDMNRRDPRYWKVRWAQSLWRSGFIAFPLFLLAMALRRAMQPPPLPPTIEERRR